MTIACEGSGRSSTSSTLVSLRCKLSIARCCLAFFSGELASRVRALFVCGGRLLPAAGMWEENGELQCEGGALECTGHRLQVCLIEKDRNDVVKYLGNIAVGTMRLLDWLVGRWVRLTD